MAKPTAGRPGPKPSEDDTLAGDEAPASAGARPLGLAERLAALGLDDGTLAAAEEAVARDGTLVIGERGIADGALAALPTLLLGEDVDEGGELTLERTIGTGGMATVWSARQQSLGRRVAVKQLRSERRNDKASAELLREARLAGALEHPNIVPVHTLGRSDAGWPVLVMKYIEGTPWKQALRPLYGEGRSPEPSVVERQLRVFMAVCTAVDYAHSRGVIHRDLKPDNVMLGAFEEVYLVDWGLALQLGPMRHARAEDVTGLEGTPGYMAPEMVAIEAAKIGPWTDVYLLGAVLHEVLLGERRHRGRNLAEVLVASHASAPFDYPPWVPQELAAICNQATHREIARRHPSAAALREAVADCLRHRASVALAEAARASLERLRDESLEAGAFAELASEARFGLRQALREWPDNARARQDLRALLELLFAHELAHDNLVAATGLLEQLRAAVVIEAEAGEPDPLANLEAELAELRARQESRARDAAELVELRRDASLRVNVNLRRRLAIINAAVLAGGAGGLFALRKLGVYEAGYAALVGFTSLLAAVVAVGGWVLDRHEGNRANRQIMASITAGCLGVVLLFVVAWIGDMNLVAAESLAMVIAATTSGVMAATLDRSLAWTGLGFLLAAILVIVAPGLRGLWIAVFGGAGFAVGSLVWRKLAAAAEPG